MYVTVWTSAGAIRVALPNDATVSDLKQLLVNNLHYDPRQIEISYGGRFVRDDVCVAGFPPNTLVAEGPRFTSSQHEEMVRQAQAAQRQRQLQQQRALEEAFLRQQQQRQREEEEERERQRQLLLRKQQQQRDELLRRHQQEQALAAMQHQQLLKKQEELERQKQQQQQQQARSQLFVDPNNDNDEDVDEPPFTFDRNNSIDDFFYSLFGAPRPRSKRQRQLQMEQKRRQMEEALAEHKHGQEKHTNTASAWEPNEHKSRDDDRAQQHPTNKKRRNRHKKVFKRALSEAEHKPAPAEAHAVASGAQPTPQPKNAGGEMSAVEALKLKKMEEAREVLRRKQEAIRKQQEELAEKERKLLAMMEEEARRLKQKEEEAAARAKAPKREQEKAAKKEEEEKKKSVANTPVGGSKSKLVSDENGNAEIRSTTSASKDSSARESASSRKAVPSPAAFASSTHASAAAPASAAHIPQNDNNTSGAHAHDTDPHVTNPQRKQGSNLHYADEDEDEDDNYYYYDEKEVNDGHSDEENNEADSDDEGGDEINNFLNQFDFFRGPNKNANRGRVVVHPPPINYSEDNPLGALTREESAVIVTPHLNRVGLDERVHRPAVEQPSPPTTDDEAEEYDDTNGVFDTPPPPSSPPPPVNITCVFAELDDKKVTIQVPADALVSDVLDALRLAEPEATKSGVRIMFFEKYVRREHDPIRAVPLGNGSTIDVCTGRYLSEHEMTLYLADRKLRETKAEMAAHKGPITPYIRAHWNELLMKSLMHLDSLQEVPEDVRIRRRAGVKAVIAEQDRLLEMK